jgi:adenylate kinase
VHIVLIGPPGAGKTVLGRQLSEDLAIPYLSSGDVARELASADPATALALQQGAWAPEEALRAHLQQKLEEFDLQHGGWILDGFPRDLAQLVCLLDWTGALPTFVHLECGVVTAIERTLGRKTRASRSDANPDAIARRLQDYERITMEVVCALDDAGILTTFDQDTVLQERLDSIKQRLSP